MKNLIVRAITGVLFVAIIVASFLDPIAMAALFALVTGLTIWEFTSLVNEHIPAATVDRIISTMAGVFFFLAIFGFCFDIVQSKVFLAYLFTIVYLFISELYLKHENPINCWAYTMLAQMYIALPLSCINILAFHATPDGVVHFNSLLPLSVFIFLWVSDTGAYCCGSLFGKHKLFPRISPGKTWEGSIGGGILVLCAAAIIYYFEQTMNSGNAETAQNHILTLPQWMGLGLTVCVFGTWGDLVESLFKRTIGIKDSGNILPGHGGMLDRFDSSLMAFPAAVVYILLLNTFGS
ncbi:MAG: phosphatidate cytidylyltransferase [Prevotella sp.]|nr:phosphatidate cytidylyltransferase [Prevotella sp.]